MRVLHVYSGNLFGGIEAILIALARSRSICPAVDHEFALCFQGKLARELTRLGAPLHHLGPVRLSRPGTVRSARAALAALVQPTPPMSPARLAQPAAFDRVVCHAPW